MSSLAEKVKQYRASLQRDFMSDLEFGSRLAKRFYLGKYLFGAVPARMVQFNLKGSLYEIVMSFGFSRVVPRKAG